MSNLNLQKLREWVWPWPWTFKWGKPDQTWKSSCFKGSSQKVNKAK